jgi:lipid II:glycine glycyltransferase (peptidoglycan interpeptide bridge formation enzyme)
MNQETLNSQIDWQIKKLDLEESCYWDNLVKSRTDGCFMQSWAWADFKELEGYHTFRYGLFDKQKLVGGCIFYYYSHSSNAGILIAPGGPVLPLNSPAESLKLLILKAENLAREIGAIALRIEPLWSEKPNYLTEFVRAPVELLPSETLLIDLRPNESKMLAAMKQKGRYNLRLSWRYGVVTKFTNDSQAIPLFYDLFWETVKRQQFFGEPYGFFINLCQVLFKANMAEIGLATWKGKILAAILMIYWGERATYLYGGRSFEHPEVRASYALHWAAMQRAKGRGCTVYDFYGFTRNPEHNYAKFSQFKKQFGGINITTIGTQDYFFYDCLAGRLIQLLNDLEDGEK